jgi:AbrB family looped-hinge helix DNA binding protein
MRITAKGQVTIPQEIREKAGLLPFTEVDFIIDDDGVRIVKVKGRGKTRGEMIVERLQKARAHLTMTTDEIMALTRGED